MWVLREKVTLTLLVIINFHGSAVACWHAQKLDKFWKQEFEVCNSLPFSSSSALKLCATIINYSLSPPSCRKRVLATQHLRKGLAISITGKHFWSPTKSHHYCVFVSLGFTFFHKVLDSWLRISSTWHVSNHNSFIPGLDLSKRSCWWCPFPNCAFSLSFKINVVELYHVMKCPIPCLGVLVQQVSCIVF